MMNLNQAVDQVRREQWREASEQDRSVIKGSRFLLLAHAENLSDTGEQRLHELLRANEELSMAYQLKEQFKGIFQYQKQGWALRALDQWCAMAQASELSPFQRLAKWLTSSIASFSWGSPTKEEQKKPIRSRLYEVSQQ